MSEFPEGQAIVYCQGAFGTTNVKTAHGLVRLSQRYKLTAIIDSLCAGRDAGAILDGKATGVPVVEGLDTARMQGSATHFVIGLAPDGGRLDPATRAATVEAIRAGLHVDSGLHDFLSEDPEISALAARMGVRIRDIRKPPHRSELHFFSGKIAEVNSLRVALLGTDSAVGKRTTAWMLVDALRARGHSAELIGTGQTSWLQGARYGCIFDSLVNDFVSGEIEHAIWSCWSEQLPEVMVLEGQGSLLNPAYPGGLELLAAGRPDVVVLQHAPRRTCYDGFPNHRMHPLSKQIEAIKILSDKPVVAVTVNHEGLDRDALREACAQIRESTGLPAVDVLLDGPAALIGALQPFLTRAKA
jgi:uncharacterized NAD-dependent epimerase/dehydratase family protein